MSTQTSTARRRILPGPGRRGSFVGALVLALAVVLTGLMVLPRGSATSDWTEGDEVSLELSEGITLSLTPSIRDSGWRALLTSNPYALDLAVTIRNDSDEDLPRWVEIEVVTEPGTSSEQTLGERSTTNTLHHVHVPAGTSAHYVDAYRSPRSCGEFTARVHFNQSFDESHPQTMEIPFEVPGDRCD
ncbi:hypothetical protein CZ771_05075 [Actinomycetales bacterium JB111]|nr:hypothetical protein CZ771_05075 [Actinomycetales bacterium JB111]